METIKLQITACPKPRMTQSDRWKARPCTVRYWSYKDSLLSLWQGRDLPDTFWVVFTMPMPKSWSEKKKITMDGKAHQSKPDTSNLLKAFEDCLLDEDSRLWDLRATKIWGREGSIHVIELKPLSLPFPMHLNKRELGSPVFQNGVEKRHERL